MSEFALIDAIRRITACSREDVVLGIGDDGAITRVPDGYDLVTVTDTMVEGVHFPKDTNAYDIGWKALAVNLSDCAAMAAMPCWASLALTLPAARREWIESFAHGFASLAKTHRVSLIGGDTTRGPLSVTVSVQAVVPRGLAVRRCGARAGDVVMLTGTTGLAAAGLACWMGSGAVKQAGCVDSWRERAPNIWFERLHRPVPRLDWIESLRGTASAAIDVSDGVLADLQHVARASGLDVEIELSSMPLDARMIEWFGESAARQLQLTGGDDYELAITCAPAHAKAFASRGALAIGRCVTGAGRVRVRGEGGEFLESKRLGYQHFLDARP